MLGRYRVSVDRSVKAWAEAFSIVPQVEFAKRVKGNEHKTYAYEVIGIMPR